MTLNILQAYQGKISNIIFLFLALLPVLTVGCGDTKPKGQTEETDSLRDIPTAILKLGATEPTKALAQIDSLEVLGRLRHYDAQFLRAKVNIRTLERERVNIAIVICEQLLTNDTVTSSAEMTENVLETMVEACRLSNDYEGALTGAIQLVNLCYQQGWVCEALRNEAEVGSLMASLGMVNEGLAKIDSVIHCLKDIRKFNELDASIIALRRKINVLENVSASNCHVDNPVSSIIEASQSILDRLADYEQHPDDYHDDTYREPVDSKDRLNYIDFCRAKAHLYIANIYAQEGRRTQARTYLHLFEQSKYSKTLGGRRSSASIYALLGDYNRALRIINEWTRELGKDTLNETYASILLVRANNAEAQGLYAEANNYRKRLATLNNILNNRVLKGKAHLYATRFNVQKQRQEIEQQKHKLHLNKIIIAFTAAICLILIAIILYLRYKWREELRRNHIIVNEVNEALKYKKQLEAHQQETPNPTPEKPSESDIFQQLSNIIVQEQLFLDPEFDRQKLIDRTGYNKNLIAAAFKEENMSFDVFIRNLRLEHAVLLFNEQPELTVKQVCFASGYTRTDSFTRAFKAKYGMTPTEFHQDIHAHLLP